MVHIYLFTTVNRLWTSTGEFPGTILTMRTAFWTFPCHPVEAIILGLKGKFGTWTIRVEACMSDEGQNCLLNNSNSNKSKVGFLTIFEISGMGNLNLLCFLFTLLLSSTWVPFLLCLCEMLLGNSAFLSVLVSRHYWVHIKKKKKSQANIIYK